MFVFFLPFRVFGKNEANKTDENDLRPTERRGILNALDESGYVLPPHIRRAAHTELGCNLRFCCHSAWCPIFANHAIHVYEVFRTVAQTQSVQHLSQLNQGSLWSLAAMASSNELGFTSWRYGAPAYVAQWNERPSNCSLPCNSFTSLRNTTFRRNECKCQLL